jgi:hypothetical protein
MSEERLLPLPSSPWGDDPPYGESIDLDEFPSVLKGLRKCRSFRADLRHKLEIIVRAHGGYGLGGMRLAARCLGVHRRTFRHWFYYRACPGSCAALESIDNAYEEALRKLAAMKCRR